MFSQVSVQEQTQGNELGTRGRHLPVAGEVPVDSDPVRRDLHAVTERTVGVSEG